MPIRERAQANVTAQLLGLGGATGFGAAATRPHRGADRGAPHHDGRADALLERIIPLAS